MNYKNKIELELSPLITNFHKYQLYLIILNEILGTRRIGIIMNQVETYAITIALDNYPTKKKTTTHDLIRNFMTTMQVTLEEIIITECKESIYYSILICHTATQTFEIECKSSDAIVLAIKFNCPIYIYEDILNDVDTHLNIAKNNNNDSKKEKIDKDELKKNSEITLMLFSSSIDELNQRLDGAIKDENYELASMIRDEIQKRKNNKN